jgi:hypothetical protein
MIFLVTKTSTSMPPTSSEGWRSYTKFKSSLERIGNKAYPRLDRAFPEFIPAPVFPRAGFGITQFATRQADPGTRQVRNLFGGVGPLQLSVVTPVLGRQAGLGLAAFRAKDLVREHEVAITGRHRLP